MTYSEREREFTFAKNRFTQGHRHAVHDFLLFVFCSSYGHWATNQSINLFVQMQNKHWHLTTRTLTARAFPVLGKLHFNSNLLQ